jgi:hypothetical protein
MIFLNPCAVMVRGFFLNHKDTKDTKMHKASDATSIYFVHPLCLCGSNSFILKSLTGYHYIVSQLNTLPTQKKPLINT